MVIEAARKSSVVLPVVFTSAVAAMSREALATTLTLPLPPSTSAVRVNAPVTSRRTLPLPSEVTTLSTVMAPPDTTTMEPLELVVVTIPDCACPSVISPLPAEPDKVTRFTGIAVILPIVMPVASSRLIPPMPEDAVTVATSVSSALDVPLPREPTAAFAFRRNAFA